MSLIDEKWELLFEKYQIEKRVSEKGLFYITADQIREYKEPRLMTKFDTRESLPTVFGNRLGILPVNRGTYVIGEFDLYEDFPEKRTDITKISGARIPDYFETIDRNEIRSEAAAINIMGIAGMLEDFFEEEGFCQTVSGRMASGNFVFQIDSRDRKMKNQIAVNNSQVEIDGGFENRSIFSIIEGKNVVHSNFLVRQLYYPFRLWREKIHKPIKPVFMVYSNNIFRLLEYEFEEPFLYHSIRLVKEKNYSLEDTKILWEDLYAVWKQTEVRPEPNVTFIQADSFLKVISLIENLQESPMTTVEIADLFGFRERQSDYYFNACRYLDLAVKRKDKDGEKKAFITERGKKLLEFHYKKRQLQYVKLILEHQIFYELFDIMLRTGEIPDKNEIVSRMRKLHLCSENLIGRRASSVSGWLRWIAELVE